MRARERKAKGFVLRAHERVPRAEPEDRSPTAQLIERRRLFCQQPDRPDARPGNEDSDAETRVRDRDRRQDRERLERGAVRKPRREQVVDGKDRVEPELGGPSRRGEGSFDVIGERRERQAQPHHAAAPIARRAAPIAAPSTPRAAATIGTSGRRSRPSTAER